MTLKSDDESGGAYGIIPSGLTTLEGRVITV